MAGTQRSFHTTSHHCQGLCEGSLFLGGRLLFRLGQVCLPLSHEFHNERFCLLITLICTVLSLVCC